VRLPDDGIVVGAARHWLVRQTGFPKLSGQVLERSKVPMSPQPLESRVEILEDRVTKLEALPARIGSIELQIVQLRSEMHGEFSAVRAEMREMKRELRQEMRELNDEIRRHMLMLHEEVIGRIALLQEGLLGGQRRPPRKRKR
jgi:hypothetical protein